MSYLRLGQHHTLNCSQYNNRAWTLHSWLHRNPHDYVLVALHASQLELRWMVRYPSNHQYLSVSITLCLTLTDRPIVTAVLIVVIALAVNGPDYTGIVNGGSGYWGEPINQPLQMRLGPNPGATMNQKFESVLNVAFAYSGNQAFVTVMCEMRNP